MKRIFHAFVPLGFLLLATGCDSLVSQSDSVAVSGNGANDALTSAATQSPANSEIATPSVPVVSMQPLGPDDVGQWRHVHTGGVAGQHSPVPGEDCAAVYDEQDKRIYIYGGKGNDDTNTNGLWSFEVATKQWSKLETSGFVPPPREDHTLILDEANRQLVLHGGEDGPIGRELYLFDLASQEWKDATSEASPFRENHTAIYDPKKKRMLTFGGIGGDRLPLADTWALNLDRESDDYLGWSQVATGDVQPSIRTEVAGVYDSIGNRFFILGGRGRHKKQYLDDLWVMDLETDQWSLPATTGTKPYPIRHAGLTFDSLKNELVVFGGEIVVEIAGDLEDFMVNSIWTLDLESMEWKDQTGYPPPMYDHVTLFVPELGGTVLYGGSSHRPVKEHAIWLLSTPE